MTVGLSAANPEVAQAKAFPLLFPLIFASSAFIPVASMRGWLQAFARNQPLSVTIAAARVVMLGGPAAHPLFKAVAWSLGLLVVGAVVAVRRIERRRSDTPSLTLTTSGEENWSWHERRPVVCWYRETLM